MRASRWGLPLLVWTAVTPGFALLMRFAFRTPLGAGDGGAPEWSFAVWLMVSLPITLLTVAAPLFLTSFARREPRALVRHAERREKQEKNHFHGAVGVRR